jgi:hypothetical protein
MTGFQNIVNCIPFFRIIRTFTANYIVLSMNKRLIFLILLCAITLTAVHAKNIYMATDGSDNNSGSLTSPYATLGKVQSVVSAGDSVFIRGGTYKITEDQIARTGGIWAYVFDMNKSGTSSRRTYYGGYCSERPVFDLSDVKPANLRIIVFYVSGSCLHFRNFEIVGTQVTIAGHTQSECFRNDGGNSNIYENISMHDGKAIGFYLVRGKNNLVLNCDAYNNWDDVSENRKGGNVDGFGGHLISPASTGNVFRGCRAWNNSDDGFDLINAGVAITVENCWSFYNGYSGSKTNLGQSLVSLGDGTGFKSGGYGMSATPKAPAIIPRHAVRFCLAVGNKNQGFYANHHLGGIDFYNNTAYLNPNNYNMLNRDSTVLAPAADVDGYGHTVKNNVSYKPKWSHITRINSSLCDVSNNSFTLSLSLTDADFASVNLSELVAPRQADGSLPDIGFLKPSAGSKLIDMGVDIGFPFDGNAPDLGYAEYKPCRGGKR